MSREERDVWVEIDHLRQELEALKIKRGVLEEARDEMKHISGGLTEMAETAMAISSKINAELHKENVLT